MQPDTEERLRLNDPRNEPFAQSNLPADVLDYKPQYPQPATEMMGMEFKKSEVRTSLIRGSGPSVIYIWCENSCDM